MKSSPQMAEPMARNDTRQRRLHTRQVAHRHEERQPDANILQHVAVLGQHDALAPVAGVGELVVRAAAVHPLLALRA